MDEPFVPAGSHRKQRDRQRQAGAGSRKTRYDERTPSTGCVNEFALFLEASALTAFFSGFRQGFSGEITPDRTDLVDGGRIDVAQIARDIERGVRVVAVHHVQAQ